ncbi:MAG: hypothetical protein ACLFPI_02460 [Desulfobacterales bacterium]
MAANFWIARIYRKNTLYLELNGDFDEMSAMELLCALKDSSSGLKEIYIETDSLDSISAFGREVFHKNFFMTAVALKKLIFFGNRCGQIAPKGANCIECGKKQQLRL